MEENMLNANAATEVKPTNVEALVSSSELKELIEILKDIQANEQKEMKYAKKQARRSVIISLCSLLVVVLLAVLLIPIFSQVSTLLDNVNTVVNDAQVSVNNLETITTQLASADIEGLFKEVDNLVLESQSSIADAMNKINAIDFEGLNDAITDLGDVIQPLADFFGGRKR